MHQFVVRSKMRDSEFIFKKHKVVSSIWLEIDDEPDQKYLLLKGAYDCGAFFEGKIQQVRLRDWSEQVEIILEWRQGEGAAPSEDDMEYNAMYHGQYRLKIGNKWFHDFKTIKLKSRNSNIQRVQEVQNWDIHDTST